jgi:hypothetical protein
MQERRGAVVVFYSRQVWAAKSRAAASGIMLFLDDSSLIVAGVEASGAFCQGSGELPAIRHSC